VSSLAYRRDVDGLRGIAVSAVVLFHGGLTCPGGFTGVDVFFVLSGFLITGLIQKDLAAGTFSFLGFWERRVRRILPASLFVTICALATGCWLLLPDELDVLSRSAAAHLLFTANQFFAAQYFGYFNSSSDFYVLLHMWSLSIEEQFYLFFPIAMYLLRNRSRAVVTAVWAVVWLGSLLAAAWEVTVAQETAFYSLHSRCWELLTGAGVAALCSRRTSCTPDRRTSRTSVASWPRDRSSASA
jgi:peptidoglycan/LPS O-acetylase OafA/YrhL